MKDVLNGFKEFISRGNAVDLAIGVVIGAAFGAVVTALVEGVITPLIAAIFGEPSLDTVLAFTVNGAHFTPGTVLTALLNFLFVAAAIYFFVVVPLNAMAKRRASGQEEVPAEEISEDVKLLSEIRDLLKANQS